MQKKIFFNYGTVGLLGKPAYKAASLFLKEYYEVGPPEILLKYEPYVDKLAQEVSKLISCREDEVVYIKNTTEGIFLASEALPLTAGDEVLLWNKEYPATMLAWLKKRQDGIVVTVLPGDDNGQMVEALIAAIGPKTKVVMVAWAQHFDGFLPDLERLGKICKEKGIYFVVDGVQGIGVRAIDVSKLPIDMLICGGQKYLGAIVGIGFMYIRKEIIPTLKHIKVGMRSMERFDSESYTIRNTARRFEDGTMNILGIVALHAAIAHINSIGIETIEKTNLQLLKQFKSVLQENGIPFIDYEKQSNVIAMKIADPVGLTDFLRARSIYVRPFKDKGTVRISFTHNSTIDDFMVLVGAVGEWLKAHPPLHHEASAYPAEHLAVK